MHLHAVSWDAGRRDSGQQNSVASADNIDEVSVSVRIDLSAGVVWLQEEGTACYDDWEAALVDVQRHPEFRPGLRYLIDGRALTAAPTREDVERGVELMRRAAGRLGAIRWAMVTSHDQTATFGTMRMTEILAAAAGGIRVRAFLDVDEALRWLTRTDPPE